MRSRTSVDRSTSFLNGSLNLIHRRHNFELNRGCATALLGDAAAAAPAGLGKGKGKGSG